MRDGPFNMVGGHAAVDFVNTVEWRLDPLRRIEDLRDYDAWLQWALQAELLDPAEVADLRPHAAAQPQAAGAEYERVIEVREQTYAVLVEESPEAVQRLADHYRGALARAELRPSQGAWAWRDRIDLRMPRDRLSRTTLSLLTAPNLTQLRQCQDSSCGWVFLDTSPRRNRRWCSAIDCGNRNRARRYYARHKGDGTSP